MATPQSKRTEIDKVHIGTMGWSYTFWRGNFYPTSLKPEAYLTEYSKHFNSVEVDNTFYRIPSTSTVRNWEKQTPAHFLFSAKFPRVITHVKMLRDCEKEAEAFTASMSQLHGKLGPLLLQFPSTFEPERLSLLKDFLSALPKSCRYAVEVRNRKLLGDKLSSLLREYNVAQVLVNQPFAPSIEEIASDFVYARWEGDRKKVFGTLGKMEVDRMEYIRKWAEKLKSLLDDQIEVFGYFSKYYSGYPPADAKQLLSLLQSRPNS
jgi:uncharacterized protein YecE (DUF72 family)